MYGGSRVQSWAPVEFPRKFTDKCVKAGLFCNFMRPQSSDAKQKKRNLLAAFHDKW